MRVFVSSISLSADRILAIAQPDALAEYPDVSLYRIRLALEDDGWHVEYELKDPKLKGGGRITSSGDGGDYFEAIRTVDAFALEVFDRRASISNRNFPIKGRFPRVHTDSVISGCRETSRIWNENRFILQLQPGKSAKSSRHGNQQDQLLLNNVINKLQSQNKHFGIGGGGISREVSMIEFPKTDRHLLSFCREPQVWKRRRR